MIFLGWTEGRANWCIENLSWTDVITELIDKFLGWTDVIAELMERKKPDSFRATLELAALSGEDKPVGCLESEI